MSVFFQVTDYPRNQNMVLQKHLVPFLSLCVIFSDLVLKAFLNATHQLINKNRRFFRFSI